MKSFIISLTFFVLTLAAVAVNCFFVDRELAEILNAIKELPIVTEEAELSELTANTDAAALMWQDARKLLSLSVENTLLRDCTVSIENLCAYCKSASVPDYNAARSDCIVRLSYLLERESFSIKNAL